MATKKPAKKAAGKKKVKDLRAKKSVRGGRMANETGSKTTAATKCCW